MKLACHKTVGEVASLAKGYPLLITALCARRGVPIVRKGRYRWIHESHFSDLIFWVAEHKDRFRPTAAAPPTYPILSVYIPGAGPDSVFVP